MKRNRLLLLLLLLLTMSAVAWAENKTDWTEWLTSDGKPVPVETTVQDIPTWMGNAETPWSDPNVRFDDNTKNYLICAWGKVKGVNMNDDSGWDPFPAVIEEDPDKPGNHVFIVHAALADTDGDAAAWDNQFFFHSPKEWNVGDIVKVSFRYKASQPAHVSSQFCARPITSVIANNLFDVDFTTEWQNFEKTITITEGMAGGWAIGLCLNLGTVLPTDFYFDDLSWQSTEASGTPVTFTRGTTAETINTWTLDNGMPAGNVTASVDYFPQAEAGDGAVIAATSAQAQTDAPLVTVDAAKLTGASGLRFFVTTTNTAPDYDDKGWTNTVPTAKDFDPAGGTAYVWYYPVGTDDTDPTKTYSDGDICAIALEVTVAPVPTYDVTINTEGLTTEEAAKWKAAKGTDTPAAFPLTGVKRGETVTVKYEGSRKVIGVKAEKKAPKVEITIEGMTLDITGCTTWGNVVTQNPDLLEIYGNSVCRKPDGALLHNKTTNTPVEANQNIDTSASYFFMNIG